MGLRYSFFTRLPTQGPHRKKLMTARRATQRGDTQGAPEDGDAALDALRGNALEIEIAANAAMRVNQATQRRGPGAKASLAKLASPRQEAGKTEQIV
jgi:hypothetical protein